MKFLPKEVYLARHEKLRERMDTEGYEAFIILNADNLFYFSGFMLDVRTWERPVALVIPRHAEPFLILNELSTSHVRMSHERGSLAVKEVYFWNEHPSSTNRTYLYLNWTQLLAHQLERRGIYKGIIATDVNHGPINTVRHYLPKLDYSTETPFVKSMRMVKCAEELEILRRGAVLSDYAQEVFCDLVCPGKIVKAVDALIVAEVIRKGAELYPGSLVGLGTLTLSGPPSAAPHGDSNSDTRFAVGDSIVNILNPRIDGYVVENERSYVLGEPTDVQYHALKAAGEACMAASSQMFTGNITANIDAAAQAVYEKYDLAQYIRHRTGHGLGIAGHEFPHDTAFNMNPLRAGEVWSAEPGIYIYGLGGFRHDNTVIVGSEPEIITKWKLNVDEMILPVK